MGQVVQRREILAIGMIPTKKKGPISAINAAPQYSRAVVLLKMQKSINSYRKGQ
jgi:hypothetical protein